MKCLKPIRLNPELSVNCGHCRACRANYTSQWKLRLIYELNRWSCASFVTLTFSDEWLVRNHHKNELCVKDLQDFFKRLRRRLNRSIRYYAVGEYGSKHTKRAHYHAIIFGVDSFNDEDRQAISDSWLPRCDAWHFDKSRGMRSAIGTVTNDSIAYVTGYVQKKLSGELAEKEYGSRKRPFSVCSRGLGLELAQDSVDILQKGYTFMNGSRICVPRYFREKLGLELPLKNLTSKERLLAENCYLRKKFDEHLKIKGIDYGDDLTAYSRAFERWFESHEWAIADRVMQDFLQRSELK